MLELEPALADRLKELRVRVDAPDPNTLFFRNVPTDRRFFNKPRTNLLLKRPQQGLPFLVCVDEDLEYTGDDQSLVRTFQSAHRQQGWRVLFAEQDAQAGMRKVVNDALGVLGVTQPQPAPPQPQPAREGRLLASFAADLTRQARSDAAIPSLGRAEELEQTVACLLGWERRMPLIAGDSGVGKTNLLHGLARRLSECRPDIRLLAVDLGALLAGVLFDAERENLLAALLKEAAAGPETVLALEHAELAVAGLPCGALLLGQALDQGVRLLGTTLHGFLPRFEVEPLARRLQVIELPEMGPAEACQVVQTLGQSIAAHHGVSIEETIAQAAVERSLTLAGRLPAKAIALLDAAAATASLAGAGHADLFHVYAAAARFRQLEE